MDHVLVARSDDPRVIKEVQVTTYHVLWELVHVFFEQPGRARARGWSHEQRPGDRVPPAEGPWPRPRSPSATTRCASPAPTPPSPVTVVRLLADDLAMVDTGAGEEEVSVALVSAAAGRHHPGARGRGDRGGDVMTAGGV